MHRSEQYVRPRSLSVSLSISSRSLHEQASRLRYAIESFGHPTHQRSDERFVFVGLFTLLRGDVEVGQIPTANHAHSERKWRQKSQRPRFRVRSLHKHATRVTISNRPCGVAELPDECAWDLRDHVAEVAYAVHSVDLLHEWPWTINQRLLWKDWCQISKHLGEIEFWFDASFYETSGNFDCQVALGLQICWWQNRSQWRGWTKASLAAVSVGTRMMLKPVHEDLGKRGLCQRVSPFPRWPESGRQ